MERGHYPYRPKALLDIPRRVFRPPDPGAAAVGRVTPFSLTPVYEVKLEDVLAGKHLPPLTLAEFEAYLMYIERTPENMHFIFWFRDYEKRYTEWAQSSTYPTQSPSLAAAFSRAIQIYFTSSSPLQLNLPEQTLATLQKAVPHAHPAPSAFADVRYHVDTMLRESLNNFVRSRTSNTGTNRGLIAIVAGICMMCVGLAPILLSVLRGRSKWLRFAAFPCFWFGCTTLLCGLNGVCIIIYLFGDARQLTAYELARPHVLNDTFSRNKNTLCKGFPAVPSHPTSITEYMRFSQPRIADKAGPVRPIADLEASKPETSEIAMFPPHTATDQYPHGLRESLRPPPTSNSMAAIAPFLLTPPGSPNLEISFDFEHLPSRISRLETGLPKSPPVFAPLTQAFDRISIRTYWETFIRSTALALLVACILVGVSFAGT